MKINHIGYAVRRIDKAQSSFEVLGFTFEPIIDDISRNVRISFGVKDGYRIELISPLDKRKESPVDQYLMNSFGTPYHFCYESDDLDTEICSLKSQGCLVIIEPKPAIAFDNKRVAFLYNSGFGLMEIVEK